MQHNATVNAKSTASAAVHGGLHPWTSFAFHCTLLLPVQQLLYALYALFLPRSVQAIALCFAPKPMKCIHGASYVLLLIRCMVIRCWSCTRGNVFTGRQWKVAGYVGEQMQRGQGRLEGEALKPFKRRAAKPSTRADSDQPQPSFSPFFSSAESMLMRLSSKELPALFW